MLQFWCCGSIAVLGVVVLVLRFCAEVFGVAVLVLRFWCCGFGVALLTVAIVG